MPKARNDLLALKSRRHPKESPDAQRQRLESGIRLKEPKPAQKVQFPLSHSPPIEQRGGVALRTQKLHDRGAEAQTIKSLHPRASVKGGGLALHIRNNNSQPRG